jgi:glycosyltransferase involved in cell wall biosynthesis
MQIAVFYHLRFGGAKRVVQEHVKGLTKLGHTVDLYSTDKENDMFDPGIYASNEYIYPFALSNNATPFFGRLQKDFDIFYRLKKLHAKIAEAIDKKNYDIVLVHTDSYTQAPFILQFLKTNNVYFCLEPLRIAYEYSLRMPENLGPVNKLYEGITRRMRKQIDQTNARSAKHTLAISYFDREYMIHAFDRYPRISYLGVDEKLFHPFQVKKKKQVLFVAEQEYIYGWDLAEKALQLIPEKQRPEMKLVFGTKQTIRISEEDLIKMYNESIVVLSLSRYDTFGLVPLESMACGVPVIALNVAGYRETMVDGKTGFLTEFDAKEIAEKIVYFLEHPDVAKNMGEQGRKWVEKKWTWDKQIKELEKLLRSCIGDPEMNSG